MYIAPSSQKITNLFYNEILPGIAKGNLYIEESPITVHFNTEIHDNGKVEYAGGVNNPDLPTMIIRDKKAFDNCLFNLMTEIYDTVIQPLKWKDTPDYIRDKQNHLKDENNRLKYYLSSIWNNLAYKDFENPIAYMQRYQSFLSEEGRMFKYEGLVVGPIAILNNYYLQIKTEEQLVSKSETPYAFEIRILDNQNPRQATKVFALPDYKYGIEHTADGQIIAYLYSIQDSEKKKKIISENAAFADEIDELLKNLITDDKDVAWEEQQKQRGTQFVTSRNEENIVDVTPSSVLGLTAILSLFKKFGISNVIIPTDFPVRWESVRMENEEEIELNYGKDEKLADSKRREKELEQYEIGRNITDKMIRNFRRLRYHFRGIHIMSYPFNFDNDDYLYVRLDDDFMPYNPNHVLSEVAQGVSEYYERGNKTR